MYQGLYPLKNVPANFYCHEVQRIDEQSFRRNCSQLNGAKMCRWKSVEMPAAPVGVVNGTCLAVYFGGRSTALEELANQTPGAEPDIWCFGGGAGFASGPGTGTSLPNEAYGGDILVASSGIGLPPALP